MQRKKMLIAVLALALMVGVVFASYTFLTSTVNVTVTEPFVLGVNCMGWNCEEDAVGTPIEHNYWSQGSSFTCSVALMASESSNGNPDVPMPEREAMPFLTIGDTPCPRDVYSGYHTFNSMKVVNDAGVPLTVTFTVTGETAKVYMVTWEGDVVSGLNGYSCEVPAENFVMIGIGVVAEGDAAPGSYTFTVTVSRG